MHRAVMKGVRPTRPRRRTPTARLCKLTRARRDWDDQPQSLSYGSTVGTGDLMVEYGYGIQAMRMETGRLELLQYYLGKQKGEECWFKTYDITKPKIITIHSMLSNTKIDSRRKRTSLKLDTCDMPLTEGNCFNEIDVNMRVVANNGVAITALLIHTFPQWFFQLEDLQRPSNHPRWLSEGRTLKENQRSLITPNR
ncbi:hypothetical protein EVAR_69466_1 [Eumeta japonica]|uniref:Uncharacterized protein n=1 Tax=Eumeta variegata TaxID=151549 RepID=A0A4C2A6R7_EUMVA|nr:hypothetical protein EVAR_69466_1 [Eumeta japonica]